MLRKMSDLKKYTMHATDGEIGRVHDFYFDDQNWKVRYMVADTSSWLFGRRVLISSDLLSNVSWRQDSVSVNLTKEQIESSPEVDTEKPVSRQHEIALHDHYGWAPYWGAGPLGVGTVGTTTTMAVPPVVAPGVAVADRAVEEQKRKVQKSDPTLRSVDEVMGYYIQGTDNEVGHVEDFFVDENDWTIRYMMVDTRNWLPGRKVLISPEWITRVSWNDSKVFVDMTQERIEESPEYNPTQKIDRDYEASLFGYYGYPGYWML